MLKRFKQLFLSPDLWNFVTKVLIEIGIRSGTVYCWNWIVSKELNIKLFGTPQLGVIQGMVLLTIIHITIGFSAFAANTTEK